MGNGNQEKTQAIVEVKERVQLAQWQRQIKERQTEGVGITEWCERQGISKSTYYYRLRKLREYLCQCTGQLPEKQEKHEGEEQRIVQINRSSQSISVSRESKIEINLGELHITFTGETPPEALKTVIEALRSC